MQKLSWIMLCGCVVSLVGCNEFVAPPERTAAIDVVGEPDDPAFESMGLPDILGSAPSLPDDAEALTEATPEPLMPKPFPEDDNNPGEMEPDINGENAIVKPVSLKTKTAEPDSQK